MSDAYKLIREYLSFGGLSNPEMMEYDKVWDLVMTCKNEIEKLRTDLAEAKAEVERLEAHSKTLAG